MENVHVISKEEEKESIGSAIQQSKAQACEKTKRVPLDPLILEKQVIIRMGLTVDGR
jgi:hypothetical protein